MVRGGGELCAQLKGTPKHIKIFESPCKSFNDGPRFLWQVRERERGTALPRPFALSPFRTRTKGRACVRACD